ncbi:transcriptional regulator [Methanoregula formicica]|uniref:Putative HTH-type transcriptional regulatory protein Metfor_2915 n=1 Tax=Methanoregula formicica (strain DSM 22288 / NBRC 105244 / SMSP) TaxID=593750 RepID=L0HIN5_METFS|nr:transcriptional regulator [Methanoregula formicica]AGB03895.1 putative transcriptional regulator [Methanoregula formicica SMSP]
MSQDRQLQLVTSVMITAGFDVSERFTLRPRSFDLIARNDGTLLVIKVVSHIDSVSEEMAFDLELISRLLGGIPLIVGERARDAELERGAVYVRYGIYAISPATLYDYFVEKIPPLVYASPGGLYVNINGDALKDLREKQNMSLGDLGNVLGVSRRTISKYESGMGTTLDVAIRIEEFFDTGVVEAIDLIRHEPPPPAMESEKKESDDHLQSPMEFLQQIGISFHTLHGAPFQALLTFDKHTILTGYGPAQKVVKRAALIGNLSQIAKKHAMCVITDSAKEKKIGRTLVISEKRLHRVEDGFELLDMLGE